VTLGGRDVTDMIVAEAVSVAASRIAALPQVRGTLLARQRAFRRRPGLVADGRDMGSVVFPDAVLKIYLTASLEERAKRRHKQLMEKGMGATMAALLQDIQERDQRDMRRATAPLQRSANAVLIDTTNMSAADAVAQVLALYQQAPQVP
ncbi:MAG: (d)CMP kinase, partial [Terriglobales bacterium]